MLLGHGKNSRRWLLLINRTRYTFGAERRRSSYCAGDTALPPALRAVVRPAPRPGGPGVSDKGPEKFAAGSGPVPLRRQDIWVHFGYNSTCKMCC